MNNTTNNMAKNTTYVARKKSTFTATYSRSICESKKLDFNISQVLHDTVGFDVGDDDGSPDGSAIGAASNDGSDVGCDDGCSVGTRDGWPEGPLLG